MATVHDAYLAFSEETVYGTAVLPTRFYELVSESLAGAYSRVESAALRSGSKVLRSDRYMPVAKGAAGDVKLEVLDKSYALLLKHMLGSLVTSGTNPNYIHTATVGPLLGKSLTAQVSRVDSAGTATPFTYTGAKVKGWELSNAVDGVLNLGVTLDAAAETAGAGSGAFAAVTPTYVTGSSLLTFQGGTVTIAGTAFPVSDVSLKGDNAISTDRWFLGNIKKEPLEDGMRKYEFTFKGEFTGLTQFQRFSALTAAGNLAVVQLVWQSPTAGQSITVDIPAARFDTGPINFAGPKNIDEALTGVCLFDGTNSPVTVTYRSTDATP